MDRSDSSHDPWLLTLQHSPIGMALVSTDGVFIAVNAALCAMLGYDAAALRSLSFQEITHPEDLSTDLEMLQETLEGQRSSYRLRKRYVRADGRLVWGDLSVALVRRDDGTPLHFVSQILDITAQYEYAESIAEARRQLEHQHRLTHALYDAVDVGLAVLDEQGRYESYNRKQQGVIRLIYGDDAYPEPTRLGHLYTEHGTPIPREDMPRMRAMRGEEFQNQLYWIGEDPLSRRAVSVSCRSIRDGTGQLHGAALASADVTELMRALQVKDEFVASVSHELRTPLTSLLGYLELLVDRDDLPGDVVDQVAVIERNANRLQHLVSDLLDVATDSSDLRIERTEVDLAALTCEAVLAMRPTARSAGVSLTEELPDSLSISGDPQRLRQVVDNLLSNAVKYTEPGGSARVRLTSYADRAELEVSDTGVGVDPAEAALIGTRFYRTTQARHRQIPGTGLGLALVRSMVEAHGGELILESTLGVGSTFRVVLPIG